MEHFRAVGKSRENPPPSPDKRTEADSESEFRAHTKNLHRSMRLESTVSYLDDLQTSTSF